MSDAKTHGSASQHPYLCDSMSQHSCVDLFCEIGVCVCMCVWVRACVSVGNTEIPDIPLASVPQVVGPHGASKPVSQLGSSIMKDAPSGPSYPPDGPVCVCVCVCVREREGKRKFFPPSLSMCW